MALGIIISAFIAQGVASSSHGARDFPYIFLPLAIMGGIGIVVIMPIGIYYLIRYRYFSKTEWIGPNKVKNYSGQTVRVGYDAAKNKAVVLDTFS